MTLRPILDRQVQLTNNRDLDGLADQYCDDAILLRFDAESVGKQAIRDFYRGYLEREPQTLSIEAYTEAEEMLSYKSKIVLGGQPIKTYGIWIVRKGKIWREFAGIAGDP